MTPAQARLARNGLGWSTRKAAEKVGMSPSTVNRFERNYDTLRSTHARLQRVYENMGVVFIGLTGVDFQGGINNVKMSGPLKRRSAPSSRKKSTQSAN